MDKAIAEAQADVGFTVLAPTYLPPTTSSIPEATVHPGKSITLLFPPCQEKTSDISGPQVIIEQSTEIGGLPVPSEEEIQIAGTTVTTSQGQTFDSTSLAMTWQQAGLSFSAHFQWGRNGADFPPITDEMKQEATRVVESIIRQGNAR